jgi:DNA-binding NtrC family response regulator
MDEDPTVPRKRFEVPPSTPTAFVLEVVEGVNRGAQFVVDERQPSPALLGQSPACTLRLTDREVSRRHAAFEIDADRLRVTDLKSTNGTFIEGVAVVEAWLYPGQIVRVGATSLRARRIEPELDVQGSGAQSFGAVLGASVQMRRLHPLFAKLAASRLPLIIEGETGTGKELLAETLHGQGPRAQGPFVLFDCTTAGRREADLLASFESANGGTLVLDEVGELDVLLQPQLLRAIDRGEIVGKDGRPAVVDVRVIGLTNRDLDQEILVGRFREDLYHRLVVTRVALPPLRQRTGDIELLASHFLRALGGEATVPPLVLSRWKDSPWPGNVRELKNAVAQLVTLGGIEQEASSDTTLLNAASAVARFVDQALEEGMPLTAARQRLAHVYDRDYVEKVLAKHGGNVTRAATAAGIERRYFQILRARRSAR